MVPGFAFHGAKAGEADAIQGAEECLPIHLTRADRYFELPLEFGTRVELAEANEAGADRRARQYALAGAYVAQRCHELIAVWDGDVHEGEGGTAQVVGWRMHGVPDVYRYRDLFFPPVKRNAPFVIAPDVGAGFVPTRLGGALPAG